MIQSSSPHDAPDLPLGHELHNRSGDIHTKANAGEHDENRENAADMIYLAHLAETDGRYGDDGHIEGVHETPAFDHHIAEGADDKNDRRQAQRYDQMPCTGHEGARNAYGKWAYSIG